MRLLRRYGIPCGGRGGSPRRRVFDGAVLWELYVAQGRTVVEMAEQLGC